MSCTIEIDDRGLATLQIEDAEGEVYSYTLARLQSALSLWSVTLERSCTDDGKDHGPYRVALEPNGAWTCTCSDCKYRGHKRPCKHAAALRPLLRFLQQLLPIPIPRQEVSA